MNYSSKIFFHLAIFFITINWGSFSIGQCNEYYINELILGTNETCILPAGSPVRFCPSLKGISIAGVTYDVSQWSGISKQYLTLTKNGNIVGTLVLNLEDEKLLINMNGCGEPKKYSISLSKEGYNDYLSAIYTEKWRKNYNLKEALKNKQYFKAYQLYETIKDKDTSFLTEINKYLIPLKKELDSLYSEYLVDFNLIKKDYYTDKETFILKNKKSINEYKILLKGEESFIKRSNNSNDIELRKNQKYLLDNFSFLYKKISNQHLITPVGIFNNYYTSIYETNALDKFQIRLIFDTLSNNYSSYLDFLKNDTIRYSGIIINENDFIVERFSMPYPEKLNELINLIINQTDRKMIDEEYPMLTINFNYTENILINPLKRIDFPGRGIINEKYESLREQFHVLKDPINWYAYNGYHYYEDKKHYIFNKMGLTGNEFYNPTVLYLMHKMYPNADSLVFVRGDFKQSLGQLALHIPFSRDNGSLAGFGSIIPLQKGVLELKNNKLVLFGKNTNYSEFEAFIIPNSKISISEFNIEKSALNSEFFSNDTRNWAGQTPIFYEQLQIGRNASVETTYEIIRLQRDNLEWTLDPLNYFYNDNVCIQLLPLYSSSTLNDNQRKGDALPSVNRVFFNFSQGGIGPDCIDYLKEMQNYFEFKKTGNTTKASKALLKADKKLEKFKKQYFYLK